MGGWAQCLGLLAERVRCENASRIETRDKSEGAPSNPKTFEGREGGKKRVAWETSSLRGLSPHPIRLIQQIDYMTHPHAAARPRKTRL